MGHRGLGSCEFSSEVSVFAVGHVKVPPQGFSEDHTGPLAYHPFFAPSKALHILLSHFGL